MYVKRFNVASSRFRPLCDKCTKLLDISTKTRCLTFYLRILFDNFKTFPKQNYKFEKRQSYKMLFYKV